LRKYNWQVDIACFQLISDNVNYAEYQYECPTAIFHYQIINVGNDARVLSAILGREQSLLTSGFERIVALRDMYSEVYKKITSRIDNTITQSIIEATKEQLDKASKPNIIHFNYAIMEIEAWFLGIEKLLERIDGRLTSTFIKRNLSLDLITVDPESEFFCPAKILGDIYNLVHLSYDKSKSVIESLVSCITIDDYETLHRSSKCGSFNPFYDSLTIL